MHKRPASYQMNPLSLHAGVAGLVASLETILAALQSFTKDLASTRLGAADTRAKDPLRDLRQDWLDIQSSPHTDLKHAQVVKLLHLLQAIEHDLDKLQEVFRNVSIYRKIPLFRGLRWRHDSEDASTSIILAKNVIHMIRALQGLGDRETMLIGSVR